jgi:anti-sigma factor RsiW
MSEEKDTEQQTRKHECLQSLIEVFLYIDGQLDEERSREIDEHLSQCKKCYGKVNFEKLIKGYLKKRSTAEAPSSGVVDSVTRMLNTSSK